jgi:magnesium-transporting ATPase (P-type)
MYSAIIQQGTGALQFFSRGSVRAVLRHCKDYWDGTGIKPITPDIKKLILESQKAWLDSDVEPIAFSFVFYPFGDCHYDALSFFHLVRYKNINAKHTKLFEESQDVEKINNIRGRQIFIGMVGLRLAPRPGAKEMISQLDKSYIRFVMLSNVGEKQTKMFGSQLGLETDWNCIISLRDPVTPPSPPKGIRMYFSGYSNSLC